MTESTGGPTAAEKIAESYKRDFWIEENLKHVPAHYRLRKCGRVVNAIARGKESCLLDIGCGPGTLASVLDRNVHYYGIDIAIRNLASNLMERDILKEPIEFGGRKFDIIVAQGLFEYLGSKQSQKFGEIGRILHPNGKFVVTYTNFDHRAKQIFKAFSNVQPMADFRQDLARHFTVERYFPGSHNWYGGQPARKLVTAANMCLNANIPGISRRLAVDYIFVCSAR
jgi:SAM-dependent methyltransferase